MTKLKVNILLILVLTLLTFSIKAKANEGDSHDQYTQRGSEEQVMEDDMLADSDDEKIPVENSKTQDEQENEIEDAQGTEAEDEDFEEE